MIVVLFVVPENKFILEIVFNLSLTDGRSKVPIPPGVDPARFF